MKYLDLDGLQHLWEQLKALFNNKVDKVSGKGLSANDYTDAEKSKLAGIAAKAEVNQNAFSNVKVGTSTVAADSKTDTLEIAAGSNITLSADTTNDKVTISAKDTTYSAATTSAAGLMSAADKTKLNGIADGANKYIHPSTHPASMITQDATHRFVTDTEKQTWADKYTKNEVDNKLSALETKIDWKEAVDTFDDIATTYPDPEEGWTVSVNDTDTVYRFNGTSWIGISANTIPLATSSVDGKMSASDKKKLDGIASGANKYVLPTASSSTLGGVKTTSNITSTSGLTACPIISGVPYYKDTNTTYNLSSFGITADASEINKLDGLATTKTELGYLDGVTSNVQNQLNGKLSTSGTAAKATADASGQNIANTYIKGLSVNGKVITYTKGDGSTGSITTQDTNTTYSDMKGATSSANGVHGLVPQPDKGEQGKFLRGDGTWQTPTNTTYSTMTGATSEAAGKSGLVPAPAAGAQAKFLRGDGTWQTPANTTYGAAGTSLGLVKSGGDVTILNGTITVNDDSHNHTIANIDNLQTTLNGKANTSHTHNYAGSSSAGGAANSANKLTTARTITLSGDASGSVSFDGSGNVTLSVSVKDDSHNHTIANIDGLQDALDDITAGSVSSAPKWTTARNINGMSVDGSANRFNYGTCSTAAATAAKTVACTGFTLATGSEITVKFTVTNTVANPTLNVNSTGAKAIYYNGAAISAGYLKANKTYTFRYNGTQYDLVGDIDTNTTYSLSSFGITATAAELNKLDGVTATATELNYVDGVTSNIQTQLNGKLSTSGTAAKATADANGQNIADTYIKALSVSGRTITYTKGDGGTGTITTQDTNTTYSNMTGASSSAAGKAGLVPAPSAGSQAKFLRGDGTWQTPTNTTYANMTGATSSAAGKAGLVPAPAAGKQTSFLRGDGTWAVPTNTDTKATQTNTTTNADYRVVLSTNANDTTETNTLRKSVNFQANPSTGAFYAKGYDIIDLTGKTQDLDDLTLSSGSPMKMLYIEKTNGGAANITNSPVEDTPFLLEVELLRWASATDYVTLQTFRSTDFLANGDYVRACVSGTWREWTRRPNTYSLSSFGITATAAELNKLDGVTATATELNYVDGVTSNIQTQLNGKASTSHTHNYAGSSSAGGAANSAVKLSTARTIRTNLGSTSTASFDGSANITPGVTGTLGIGNGGTGATTAAAARTKLGFSGIVVSSSEPTTQNTNEFWLRAY